MESATGNIGLLWGAPKCGAHDPYYKAKNFPLFGSAQALFRCAVKASTCAGLKLCALAANDVPRGGGGVQVILQKGSTGKGARGSHRHCPSPADFVRRQGESEELVTNISMYQPGVKHYVGHAVNASKAPLLISGKDFGVKTTGRQANYIFTCLESLLQYMQSVLLPKKVNVYGSTHVEANVLGWSSVFDIGPPHTALGMLQAGLTSLTGCLHGSTDPKSKHEPVIVRVGEFSSSTFCRLLKVMLDLCVADGGFHKNSRALSSHSERKIWDLLNSAGMSPFGKWEMILREPVEVNLINKQIWMKCYNIDMRAVVSVRPPYYSDLEL